MIGDIWVAPTNFGKHTKQNNMLKNIILFLGLAVLLVLISKLIQIEALLFILGMTVFFVVLTLLLAKLD